MSEQPFNPYEAPQEELQKITPEEDEVSKSLKADLKRFLWSFPFVLLLGAMLMMPVQGMGLRLALGAVLVEILVIFMIVVRVKGFRTQKSRLDAFLVRWGVFPIFLAVVILYSFLER